MFGFKKLRQKWQSSQPFPEEWLAIIQQNVPYYERLPAGQQQNLRKRVQRFISKKSFEGCGGLTLTDEMKVTIAAQACILILGSDDEIYPLLRAILIYPHDYFARVKQTASDGVITEGIQARAGESWSYGNVVLAWDDVQHGANDPDDGENLVFHEFAHQLDREYGATARIEAPPDKDDNEWTRTVRKAYRTFIRELHKGQKTLLNPYGAKNPAEFFAVTTEYFFERPLKLRQKYPELYEQFRLFYQQNPSEYFD
ncbi:MAG TPA: M90 family metallopeptidase [Balneolaceae bacterium]|nr:M90 family metallopeptidase [Balneolaceae bacterium]